MLEFAVLESSGGRYVGNDAAEVDRMRVIRYFSVSTVPSHSLQPYTIPCEYQRTYNMKHCFEGRITVIVFFNYVILSFSRLSSRLPRPPF